MAYQPKFARGKKPPQRIPQTEQRREAPVREVREAPVQKMSGLRIALTVLIVPVSLVLCFWMLSYLFQNAARPKAPEQAALKNMTIRQSFDGYVSGELTDARKALDKLDAPEAPTVETTEATIPPYEVVYTLDADTQVAPEPNQALFGQTNDREELLRVMKEAEYILDGQELFFHPDRERFEGSTVTYYLDETIFAVTWKEPHDKTVYTFSEVKVGHASQFRRHLSDGAYGSGKLYLPTEMAATVNAVVATSGDFYANRPIFGVVAYEGQVRRDVDDGYGETCYIDDQGNMIFSHMKELKSTANAQAFIDEHNIQFSLAFGPILVENYEVRELPNVYGVGEIREEYARSALCQMDDLHYLIAVANWEGNQPDDPTVARFQKVIATVGAKMAYCLDGGQTAAVVMNDQLINRPAKGEQRRISDIIYFATAVPEGG